MIKMAKQRSLQEMQNDASNGALVCPLCGCNHFLVYRTERGKTVTRRYKACRNCGDYKVVTSTEANERIIREVGS